MRPASACSGFNNTLNVSGTMTDGTRSSTALLEANHSSPTVRVAIWSEIQFRGSSAPATVLTDKSSGASALSRRYDLGKCAGSSSRCTSTSTEAPAGFGAKHLEWSATFEASLWRPEPLKGRFLVSHNCLRAGKNSRCANCSFRFFLRKRLMAALAVLPSAQGNDNVEHFDATKALVEKMVDDLGRETCFDQTHNRLFGLGSRAEPVLQILVQPLGRRCGHFRTLLGIST